LSSVTVLRPADMTAPCLRVDVDVAQGISAISPEATSAGVQCAWFLVRMHDEPLGTVLLHVPAEGLSVEQIVEGLTRALGPRLADRAASAGSAWPGAHPDRPLKIATAPPFLATRGQLLRNAPEIATIVCTRERPVGLRACLSSLAAQNYPNYSVLVVDNAPVTSRSRQVVEEFSAGSMSVEYAVESRPGLAWARNRALELVTAGILAWIDDDEEADPYWLCELARGFVAHPEAGAVSGIMLPAELLTPAQVWFEQYGGHHKHRGFESTTFGPTTGSFQSPLYPLPPFATGGNMAFRRNILHELGGFDPALGAGSLSLGAEDTKAFTDYLRKGGTIVYQPTAITHHWHRRTVSQLRRQMFGYGAGLTAFYTALVLSQPQTAAELLGLAPSVLRDAFGPNSLRSDGLGPDFPSGLRWANRWGLAQGPVRYLAARLIARRRSRRAPARMGGQGVRR
jgi:hypothetical protein